MKQNKMDLQVKNIPLLSWDIMSGYLFETFAKSSDLTALTDYKQKFKWNLNLDRLLEDHYQALVLTDLDQRIMWVNPGFSTMTGYDFKEALLKSPKFLQGPATDKNITSRIGARIVNKEKEPFTEIVTNYRKSKEVYKCKVTIVPLLDSKNNITHYLALELEVA